MEGRGRSETFLSRSGEKIMSNVPEEELNSLFLLLMVTEEEQSRIVYHLLKVCLDGIKGFLTFEKGSC